MLHFTEVVALLVSTYGENHVNFLFKEEGYEGLVREANTLQTMLRGAK